MLRRIVAVAVIALTLVGYFAGQKKNPPGFYIDESSIAYNALCIARNGHDEHDVAWPLYFKAFGEYKNPIFIYVVAAAFKVTHPSNLVARRVAAIGGYLGAAMMGVLAYTVSRRRWIAWATFLLALATPMLFEISRLAFEVALYPLAVAFFFWLACIASRRDRWSARLIAALVVSLALVTFTYSTGRLLGLLFALLLFILADSRPKLLGAAIVLGAYALTVVLPLSIYNRTHHGALTARFKDVSYLYRKDMPAVEKVTMLERQYVENLLPLGMVLVGDDNDRHHVRHALGGIYAGTFVLAIASAVILVWQRRRDRWWIFVVMATFLSVVPVSMMQERYHALRMAPYPVLLLLLAIPAMESARRVMRGIVIASLVLCAAQAVFFFSAFAREGPKRLESFDALYPEALHDALAQPNRPIYLPSSYVHAFWYGALEGVPRETFVVTPLGGPFPPQSLLIGSSHFVACDGCREVGRHGEWVAWVTPAIP